jgi:3-hydroxyacyl-[acyl-carrier-protein] dehydratase
MAAVELPVNINEIMRQIPHRYPLLLVDRVLALDPGKKITTLKNVTINEQFFVGHFENYPVMPGVLIIEAMAQSAGILSVLSFGERQENELYFFAAINNARFKRQVIPGDALHMEVELVKLVRGVGKYVARAFVDGVLAAEAELLVAKKEV